MTAGMLEYFRFRNHLLWLGVTLALACAAVCLFNWRKLSGLQYGYFYGVFADPPSMFGYGAPDYFSSMNVWYFSIVSSLALYLLACLFSWWRASGIFRLAVLCISVFPFVNMLDYKTKTYGMDSFYYTYYGLTESYFLDWACFGFIVAIMIVEVIILRSHRSTAA